MTDSPSGLSALVSASTLALILSACGNGDQTHDDAAADAATASVEGTQGQQEETSEDEEVDFPDTPAGQTAEHALEVLNAAEDSTAEDWEGRLSEAFQADFTEQELAEVVNLQIRPAAPFTATNYQGTETRSLTRVESAGEDLDLHVELDEQEQLTALLFAPAQDAPEAAESFDEIEQRLHDMPGEARLLVTDNGEEILSIGADEPAAMGSIFKLWVLEALVRAVDAGETDWEETLELGEQHISLPAGQLQNEDPGYKLSVFDAAYAMISISDNTATDLLIDHIGRDAVEHAVQETGHHNPGLLQPLLTTREFFQLRWGDEDLGLEYGNSDEQRQREILEDIAQIPLEISASDLTPDRGAEHGLEWFAAAEDIAAVHDALDVHKGQHPELQSILGDNPGIFAEDAWWTSLDHKGGSSPGVLASSWRAEGANGTWRTVVIQISGDPEEVAAEGMEYLHLAQNALELDAPS